MAVSWRWSSKLIVFAAFLTSCGGSQTSPPNSGTAGAGGRAGVAGRSGGGGAAGADATAGTVGSAGTGGGAEAGNGGNAGSGAGSGGALGGGGHAGGAAGGAGQAGASGGAGILPGQPLVDSKGTLVDLFVVSQGIVVVDASSVSLVGRDGTVIKTVPFARTIAAAALDGSTLVIVDTTQLTVMSPALDIVSTAPLVWVKILS